MQEKRLPGLRITLAIPRVVTESVGYCWYPDLLKFSTGELMMNYRLTPDASESFVTGAGVLLSHDGGATWVNGYDVNGFHGRVRRSPTEPPRWEHRRAERVSDAPGAGRPVATLRLSLLALRGRRSPLRRAAVERQHRRAAARCAAGVGLQSLVQRQPEPVQFGRGDREWALPYHMLRDLSG